MATPDPTLHDFVLNLLSDDAARQAFDLDPTHALSSAGLPDVTPQDVLDAVPLVMDFASANGEGLDVTGGAWGNLDDAGMRHNIASPLGTLAGDTEAGATGVHNATWLTSDHGSGQFDLIATPNGDVEGSGWLDTPLGGGSYAFAGGLDGFDGNLHLSGSNTDAIGKGGDLVTGTVAGFVTDGASTFNGVLTEGAASLAQHVTGGAVTADGLITDGAGMLSDTVADPTSLTSLPAGVPDITSALPLDVGSLPALPALPVDAGLPDVGHLPVSLPDLPLDLTQLPLDLPSLSELPAVPQLPSLPGVDSVHDTVAGMTGNVPLVGDLTDGLTDHLPFGH